MNLPPRNWNSLIATLAGRRVLVVGDVMLDDYWSGDAKRVCPEAPVPVVEVQSRWSVPGGAGNAAANVVSLGGQAVLGGVIGADHAGEHLREAIANARVEPTGLVADSGRPTTVKLRILTRGHQVVRADTERVTPLTSTIVAQLSSWVERTVPEVDAVLLSDYGKGVFGSDLARLCIAAANRANRPVVVDPKGSDGQKYQGATIIKPNLSELVDLTGSPVRTNEELIAAGWLLTEQLAETAVLVTRGSDGVMLFQRHHQPRSWAATPLHRVFDVTGAGDTVAATLALALGARIPLEQAIELANAAGGVVVSKVGTASVTPGELRTALA